MKLSGPGLVLGRADVQESLPWGRAASEGDGASGAGRCEHLTSWAEGG